MLTKSFIFAAIAYGIALAVSLLVVVIIRITYIILRRTGRKETKAEPGQKA